jgi:CRP-like cAMP-binding protein
MQLRTFPAGTLLFREGDPGDFVYVLRSGQVRVWRREGLEERTLALLGPGEIVGEWALVNQKPRSASCTVVEPAECIVVNGVALEKMLGNPEIAVRLVRKLIARLAVLDDENRILLHTDGRSRLLLALLREAEERGTPVANGVAVARPVEEIADHLGARPEDVQALLASLRRAGLAAPGPDLVLRVDGLREVARRLESSRGESSVELLIAAAAAAKPR